MSEQIPQDQAALEQSETSTLISADKVKGTHIYNSAGEHLGEIETAEAARREAELQRLRTDRLAQHDGVFGHRGESRGVLGKTKAQLVPSTGVTGQSLRNPCNLRQGCRVSAQ